MTPERNRKRKKKIGKQNNALTHGLYAGGEVLPFESRADFEILHNEYRADFDPRGRAEEDAVLDMVRARWLKLRSVRMINAAFLQDPFTLELQKSGQKTWPGIRKYLRRQSREFGAVTQSIGEMVSELTKEANGLRSKLSKDGATKEEIDLAEHQISAIVKLISEHALPLMQQIDTGPSAKRAFLEAHAPELLEKIARAEAAIDARYDKAFARLVNLQEYRRLAASRRQAMPQLEHMPANSSDLPAIQSWRA